MQNLKHGIHSNLKILKRQKKPKQQKRLVIKLRTLLNFSFRLKTD